MEQKSHGSNSFILGVVLGVILTLLFTTKKGRKIMATLTDEGLSKFSDLEKAMRTVQQETADSVEKYVDEELEEERDATSAEMPYEAQDEPSHNGTPKKSHSIGRRFFRGTHKRG